MALQGNLSKFSMPEIFQFLEKGYKTGLLSVRLAATTKLAASVYYIWLHQGRIVAAANRLDSQSLLAAIATRGWVSSAVLKTLSGAEVKTGLGLYLKSQGLLQAEQLKLLFRAQVTGNIYPIFQFADGQFEFDQKAPLPTIEMTGLSIPATEATLMALRALQDWTVLAEKLPNPKNCLVCKIQGQPQLHLLAQESQVWDYADGKLSLSVIAQKLGLSIEQVQQIAFRLMVSNLVEEVFAMDATTTANIEETKRFDDFDTLQTLGKAKQPAPITQSSFASNGIPAGDRGMKVESVADKNSSMTSTKGKISDSASDSSSKANISSSFLQNLVGFLQTKTAS